MERKNTDGATDVAKVDTKTEEAVVTAGAGQLSTGAPETDVQKYNIVTGDPEYVRMIHNVCDSVATAQNQTLDMYWNMGDAIQSFIGTLDSKNVSAALKQICQHVSEASNDRLADLSQDSLRKALKVREKLSKVDLELAKAGGVSLRNLLPMCKNDVSHEEREEILKDVTEGTLDQKEIKDKVKELHPPAEKQEKRGGARKKAEDPLDFMKRIQSDMDKLLTDMKANYPQYAAAVLGSEDQATKEKYTEFYEANAEQIARLNKQWTVNEAMTKAFLTE